MTDREIIIMLLGATAGALGAERMALKLTNRAFGSPAHTYKSMPEFLYSSMALRRSTEIAYQALAQQGFSENQDLSEEASPDVAFGEYL